MILLAVALALTFPAPEPVAILHVSVVNVISGRVQKDVTVRLSDGVIASIGRGRPVDKAKVIDGTGRFLIPGLWDMHVHCVPPEATFPLFLANGVTGIRDMFGLLDDLKTWRTKVENGTALGPRMVFSGPIVDGPKPMWPASIVVNTPEEGRKAVQDLQEQGADFVKVYSGLPREAYFAIADEAKKRHMVFAGHVPDRITAAEASDAGQKSCEHLYSILLGCSIREPDLLNALDQPMMQRARAMLQSYNAARTRCLFALLRQNRTWQCPTLTLLDSLANLDQPAYRKEPPLPFLPRFATAAAYVTNTLPFKTFTRDDWECARLCFAKRCELVGMMAKSGVGILAGTDTPNPGCFPGFGIHDELALLVRCGLTPRQALQAATINPARYFGWERVLGTVQAGKAADLVLLEANPLEDIHNTTRIAAVFLRGRHLDRATLDQMLLPKPVPAAIPGR